MKAIHTYMQKNRNVHTGLEFRVYIHELCCTDYMLMCGGDWPEEMKAPRQDATFRVQGLGESQVNFRSLPQFISPPMPRIK